MPKRRVVGDESDSDEQSTRASQSSKRARTDDSNLDTPEQSQETKPRLNGKRKSRRDDDDAEEDEDDEDIDQMTPDEDEEKRFEDEHEDKIRAKVLGKSKAQGGIAEMGIIEKLEMHQFMCHKYLTFTFGPQINFIIGHNGSGKSAVLSALTVALGGKATTTGRGSGLKSFIKEGQGAAEVSVTIKNQGDEAYKPKEYGSSIIITRRFTKDGQSSYKIKSKDGKQVSSKRDELSAICDHMNIQVDNPMNILTQDSARQFLSASAPADKYKFFLRGTQLSQLSEEYSTCLENITQTQKVLVHKSGAIPDLEEALMEATARFQEAAKAREQRHKADELKKELAWSHVASKEKEMRGKMEECEKQRRRIPKVEEGIAAADKSIQGAEEKVQAHEEELSQLGSIEHLREKRKEVQEKIKKGKNDLQAVKGDEKQINESLQNVKKSIEKFTALIDEEERKRKVNTESKREETSRKLEEAVRQVKAAEEEANSIKDQIGTLHTAMENAQSEGQAATRERQQVRLQIDGFNEQLKLCDDREKSKLAPYGKNMDAVLTDIGRAQWHGMKPIGPFGMYVKVRDPQWAGILRIQLGGTMSSFAVTDARDRPQLDQILKLHQNVRTGIVITEKDLFDYTKGEPPTKYMTVLRALEISDEFVLRILINQNHIESTMLGSSRKAGDDMLIEFGRGGLAWTQDLYRVQRYPEGGGSSQVLYPLAGNDQRQQLFRGEDIGSQRNEILQQLREAERQHRALDETIKEHQRAFQEAGSTRKGLLTREQTLRSNVKKLREKRDALQDEVNEDTPIEIQALFDEREQLEREKQSLIQQYTDISIKSSVLGDAQHPLVAESADIKRQMDEYDSSRMEIRSRIEAAAQVRIKAQADKTHYLQKQADEQQKLDVLQKQLTQLETEFEAWTQKALKYCEPFPNPRDHETVDRDLIGVQNALKEREKRQGASVEEMTIEVNKKKVALDTARKELKSMMALNKALRKSIRVRLKKWHEFRRHIALRCKIYFSYHLSIRGYYGKVLFDHVHGTLQLKVQTDDQTSTQNTREKDPRSLSGGEKSFSTICLLLSLWESIGCPIRCLDEFDVFMDAVNRRISMKMMIETANASNRKQYILITPQDMTNVHIGPSVRVHRMSDPERGQGVLALS